MDGQRVAQTRQLHTHRRGKEKNDAMSIWLGPAFHPSTERRPTRMSSEDWEIWRRWFPQYRESTKLLYFDVGLGPGRPAPDPDINSPYRRAWLRNTQRRADVVMVREEEIWLVELRFLASPNAVGRLLVYANLWQKDPPFPDPLKLHLVTNEELPDVAKLTQLYNIQLHIT